MIQRYALFEVKLLALSDEDSDEKKFIAIPEDDLKTGIFVAARDPTLAAEPSDVVEAENAEKAIAAYRDKIANMMM